MSKHSVPRRLADNEATAILRNLRTSAQKLNLVARTIRGKSVETALVDLKFSKRRIANDVRKTLQSAIANAENNHDLEVDQLFVAEVSVGNAFIMKRIRPRARGRVGRIRKPYSHLTIVVRERQEDSE